MLIIRLEPRERDTILAALRLWQDRDIRKVADDWGRIEMLDDIATNGGAHEALDENEIDILIEDKINLREPRKMPVCSHCGSDAVVFDACAEYDPDTDNYSLVTTYDSSDCQRCDGACSVKWVDPDVYVVPDYVPDGGDVFRLPEHIIELSRAATEAIAEQRRSEVSDAKI